MKQLHYTFLLLLILSSFVSCATKRTATSSDTALRVTDTTALTLATHRDTLVIHRRDTTVLHLRDSLVITERIVEHYSSQDGTLLRRDIDRRTLQLRDSLAALSHRLDSLSAHSRDTLTHTNHHIESSSSSTQSKVAPAYSSARSTFALIFILAFFVYMAIYVYRLSTKKHLP